MIESVIPVQENKYIFFQGVKNSRARLSKSVECKQVSGVLHQPFALPDVSEVMLTIAYEVSCMISPCLTSTKTPFMLLVTGLPVGFIFA